MQNEKTTQQLIREYEAQMPQDILNLIKSFDWRKEVRTIVNQNQLMIDVGADLEESIYLMLLGVVTAADFYERLVDVHEIPEDKARKILEETEATIFNPMYQKLMALDGADTAQANAQTIAPTTSTTMNSVPQPTTPRDQMLAEIEKEPEPLIKINFAPKEQTQTQSQGSVELDGVSVASGVTKPFTLSPEKSVQPEIKKIDAPEPVKAEEAKPVDTALTQPTIAQTPKPYVADPYREPIE